MTMVGIDREVLVAAVLGVRPEGEMVPGEAFARAAWSGIAEPGDSVAGLAVAALGAEGALAAVTDDWGAERLVGAVADAGGDELNRSTAAAAIERWRPRAGLSAVLESLAVAARRGVRLRIPGDRGWPEGLDDLGAHGPIALWTLGHEDVLRTLTRSIALVGARAATGYGEHIAMESAAGLVDRGFTIVSGAAYGIDGMAHRAALASGGGTVAFLAGGVDRVYPSGHDSLLRRIEASGVVASELPCGANPTRWRFLQRNRLIAAASRATVVIEAGSRSGSLNTAGHAAAIGRPLGAVPGPVTSAASAGCHRLIREYDAICVTSADEMAELVVGPSDNRLALPSSAPYDAERVRVLDALSSRARSIDDIARLSGLSVATVQSMLGLLELEGIASVGDSGWHRG
jgi:DNA processing protein